MAEAPPSSEALEHGHEIRDISPRAIVWTGIGVALTIVFSALIAYAWIDFSVPKDNGWVTVSKRLPSQVPGDQPSRSLPGVPIENPEVLTAKKEAILKHSNWVDRKAGIVSIPIERAMQLVARRGLPDFSQGAPANEQRR